MDLELIPDRFGRMDHSFFYLFFLKQDHVLDPGNLDNDDADQRKRDQDRNDGKNSFQSFRNI
jgi:hypothetical protein